MVKRCLSTFCYAINLKKYFSVGKLYTEAL